MVPMEKQIFVWNCEMLFRLTGNVVETGPMHTANEQFQSDNGIDYDNEYHK